MSKNLTPWFEEGTTPKRKGIYQVAPRVTSGVRWSYWDGRRWSFFTIEKEHLQNAELGLHAVKFAWRGLASDPAKDTK